MGGHLLLPPSFLQIISMTRLWLPDAPSNASNETNMYTLRHPRERAAALHLPPAKANGLEEGAWWAGEEGVLVVVEHDEAAGDVDDEAGWDKRLLLTVVKSWCMMVPTAVYPCVLCGRGRSVGL